MSKSARIILRKLDITILHSVLFPESYFGKLSKSFLEMLHRSEIRLGCTGNMFRDIRNSLVQ